MEDQDNSLPVSDIANPTGVPHSKITDLIQSPHNKRLYNENQTLKKRVNILADYQLAHIRIPNPTTRDEIDSEKKIQLEIGRQEKMIKTQLAVIRTLYRQSVIKVREQKAKTAEARGVNDALILGLQNLKYEEQSLRSEISAAENYDHKYMKLPLVPVETFLKEFPEHKDSSDHNLMTARIEHEHQVRVKLEERRQEKLKQKQKLIAEVKKSKDDLTKLDGMVEKFIEAAEPIKKVLATE
ncbi:Fms-interacting protein-domain-containing protein [Massariosphaeria phaeospora]|uniref:Fms-interacting protein-domain-containing protein n=1 Tax=Massariosphaeria phaeospora TaxID=100035 RepID=A0A7C8ID38_9PLEO|nr:Fms-interacting protein-domain-containing protein [Massariosphaeria phaeospora]